MNSIVVIGTQPPCPRCQLLTNVVSNKVEEMGLNATVRHLSYTLEEAREFAKTKGLMPGTANDVAKVANMEIDLQELKKLLQNKPSDANSEFHPYNNCGWSKNLDIILRPFEVIAKDVGIMMTPVLIINGDVKHQGSVPELSKIEEWLSELK